MNDFSNDAIDLKEISVSGGDLSTTWSDSDGCGGSDVYDTETLTIIYFC